MTHNAALTICVNTRFGLEIARTSYLCIAALCLTACIGCAQEEETESARVTERIRASRIQWEGIRGTLGSDRRRVYVLMARGFMGWPGLGEPTFASDLNEQIASWLKRHPKAYVVPVWDIPLGEDTKLEYVWVIDKNENLNHVLVLRGACMSDNMLIPDGQDDLLVAQDDYDQFAKTVADAEMEALEAKRGVWGLESYASEVHWKRATYLEDQAKYEEAIAEFQSVVDGGSDSDLASFRMAECYEKLGRYDKAVAAYDKSIVPGSLITFSGYLGKARCISQTIGSEKAVEMLQELMRRQPGDLEPYRILSAFYREENRFDDAVATLEEGFAQFLSARDIRFDEKHQFLLEPLRVDDYEGYWKHLHLLPSSYSTLGIYCLESGGLDKAFKYATMGLSMKQGVMKYLARQPHFADKYTSEIVEAGDVECRYVRARVFSKRSAFAAAKTELDHAKILIDSGQLRGSDVRRRLEYEYSELAKRFPEETVAMPSKYVPQPPKRQEAPSINCSTASESQLIEAAAGSDNPTAYSALQELIRRDTQNTLAPDDMKRIVADGLERQRDPDRWWCPFYGTLIERAYARKLVTDDQLVQYAGNAVKLKEFSIRPVAEWENLQRDPKFSASLRIENRVGGLEHQLKESPPSLRLVASIRMIEAKIDGEPVSVHRGNPPRIPDEEFELLGGGGPGFGYFVCTEQELKAGKHTHSVLLQIEVRKVSKHSLRRKEKAKATPPLATRSVEKSFDFWFQPSGKH